jgi:hypothetical protein
MFVRGESVRLVQRARAGREWTRLPAFNDFGHHSRIQGRHVDLRHRRFTLP